MRDPRDGRGCQPDRAYARRWRREHCCPIAAARCGGLAAHGWPYLNSDEAVMALMGVDIWRHGARPIFTYSQDDIGSLQAYLSAPLFALLNGDPLALRLATLVQTMLFLVVMYVLARRLYAPGVALLTLALLALGPEYALNMNSRRASARRIRCYSACCSSGWPPSGYAAVESRRAAALDTGIGLAIGLGLWGDFRSLPYVAVAVLALGATALHALAAARRDGNPRPAMFRLMTDGALVTVAALLGAAPLLAANIASGGGTFRHVTAIAGTPGSGSAMGRARRSARAIRRADRRDTARGAAERAGLGASLWRLRHLARAGQHGDGRAGGAGNRHLSALYASRGRPLAGVGAAAGSRRVAGAVKRDGRSTFSLGWAAARAARTRRPLVGAVHAGHGRRADVTAIYGKPGVLQLPNLHQPLPYRPLHRRATDRRATGRRATVGCGARRARGRRRGGAR